MKNEMKRTTTPKKHPIRIELENFIIGYNKILRDVVGTMDNLILLRNAHPSIRTEYAYRFRDIGLITPEEAKEFTMLTVHKPLTNALINKRNLTLKMMKQ
jgi:hypothetical protein